MHINKNGIHSLSPSFGKHVQSVMKDFGVLLKQDRDEAWKWGGGQGYQL